MKNTLARKLWEWAVLREIEGFPFTAEDAARALGLKPNTVRCYLKLWARKGGVKCAGESQLRKGRPATLWEVSHGVKQPMIWRKD